jgi:uncharacterized protein (DUF58 family)
MFTDRVERYVPPKKGRAHVMRVVTEILSARPQSEGTNVQAALDYLGSITKRRSVAFLVSDFQDQGYEHALRVASARHDLIPVNVVDPREVTVPDVGLALIEDLESGEIFEVDTADPRVRQLFEERISRERAQREQMFRRLRMDHVTVRTDEPYVKPIVELFRMRSRRLRGFR